MRGINIQRYELVCEGVCVCVRGWLDGWVEGYGIS